MYISKNESNCFKYNFYLDLSSCSSKNLYFEINKIVLLLFYIFKQTNHLELFLMYKKNTLFSFYRYCFQYLQYRKMENKGTIVNATTNEPVEFAGIKFKELR